MDPNIWQFLHKILLFSCCDFELKGYFGVHDFIVKTMAML